MAKQEQLKVLYQFPLEADRVECVPCRKDEQRLHLARRRYEGLLGQPVRRQLETAELIECGVLLVDSSVFSVKVVPKLRGLLKTLLVDDEGPDSAQLEQLGARINSLAERQEERP